MRTPVQNDPRPGCPKRLLFVSYPFPPVGGAGVQRTTKFVKYLPHYGWRASVLTVANPSVPAFDESLAADVPPETVVCRAKTWEPSYALKSKVAAGVGGPGRGVSVRRMVKGIAQRITKGVLQPDAQILWAPGAIREGLRLLRRVEHDAIVATGPPFSSFLIGAVLARKTGLPLVLDYRDEWDLSNAYWENRRLGPLSRRIQSHLQARVVRAAKVLVATTRHSARALAAIRAHAGGSAAVRFIYNGFDPEDFAGGPPPGVERPGRYRLSYIGTLWELTTVAGLVRAVQLLSQREPTLAADLQLVFAGRRTGPQQQLLEGLKGLPCEVIEHPYVDHARAVELLWSSDGLCALLSDLPNAGRVVPAKLFEYMACRKPILSVAPRGELWDLLEDYPARSRHTPDDAEGIADALAREIRRRREGGAADFRSWDGSRFDRKVQAGQLAAILESLR